MATRSGFGSRGRRSGFGTRSAPRQSFTPSGVSGPQTGGFGYAQGTPIPGPVDPYTDLVNRYQQQVEAANAANRARQQQISGMYGDMRTRSAGLLSGLGQQQRADAISAWEGAASAGMQDLVDRGLRNTSVAPTMRAGYERRKQDELRRIGEESALRELSVMNAIDTGEAGFLERINETGPNMAMLTALAQGLGTAGPRGTQSVQEARNSLQQPGMGAGYGAGGSGPQQIGPFGLPVGGGTMGGAPGGYGGLNWRQLDAMGMWRSAPSTTTYASGGPQWAGNRPPAAMGGLNGGYTTVFAQPGAYGSLPGTGWSPSQTFSQGGGPMPMPGAPGAPGAAQRGSGMTSPPQMTPAMWAQMAADRRAQQQQTAQQRASRQAWQQLGGVAQQVGNYFFPFP